MKITTRNCPLCQQPLIHSGDELVWYCNTMVDYPQLKHKSHYQEETEAERISIIIPPYRLLTEPIYNVLLKKEEVITKLGILSKYKTGKQSNYFKTLLRLPPVTPDTEENLKKKIKILLVFL